MQGRVIPTTNTNTEMDRSVASTRSLIDLDDDISSEDEHGREHGREHEHEHEHETGGVNESVNESESRSNLNHNLINASFSTSSSSKRVGGGGGVGGGRRRGRRRRVDEDDDPIERDRLHHEQGQRQRQGQEQAREQDEHEDEHEHEHESNVQSLSYRDRDRDRDRDREEDVSIPSLVDASDDFDVEEDEESQSQTSASTGTGTCTCSVTSSSLHSIKEGTTIGKSRSSTGTATSNAASASTSALTMTVTSASSASSSSFSALASSSSLLFSERDCEREREQSMTKLTAAAAKNTNLQGQQQQQYQYQYQQQYQQQYQVQVHARPSSSSSSTWNEDRNPSQRSCEKERQRQYDYGTTIENNNNHHHHHHHNGCNTITGSGSSSGSGIITNRDSDSPIVRKGVSDETVNTSNLVIDIDPGSKEDLFLIGDDDLEVQRQQQQQRRQRQQRRQYQYEYEQRDAGDRLESGGDGSGSGSGHDEKQQQQQQKVQVQEQQQQIDQSPNNSLTNSSVNNDTTNNDTDDDGDDTSYRYTRGIFEKSIDYVTDFFSCSTPNISTRTMSNTKDAAQSTAGGGSDNVSGNGNVNANVNANDASSGGTDLESQLQNLQMCIEIDILNIMGCSAEGAQQFIDSLGQSIFCQQCQCQCSSGRIGGGGGGGGGSSSGDNGNGSGGSGMTNKYCPKCHPNATDVDPASNRPKIRNRNVYVRSKAAKRIRRLREGGLSRHFSLSPVYTFLAEDMDIGVVHEENSNSTSSRSSTSGKKAAAVAGGGSGGPLKAAKKLSRGLIPRSKKPKSLSGDKRQTSLGGCSTSSQYEPTILTTRSHDFSIDEEFFEEEEKGMHKREVQSDFCGRISSAVGERLLFRIFSGFRDQRNDVPSEEQIPDELYYDSDPGTHVGSTMSEKSDLRKLVAKASHGRSKSVGIVDGFAADIRRLETNLYVSKKSLLETLDIYTFNINDSAAISMLIKELIASSFSLIWHPKKGEKGWSDSSTAPPHRVKAWFEMGSCLKKALLQPKFVWRSNDNLQYSSRHMKVKSIHRPESVELLNIVRIVVPKEINRQLHPFVKKECAFTIVTNTEEDYLFEAATQDERDKFVFAFKVMVARLASKIIVGDKDVFDEFFTPLGVAKKKKKRRRRRDRQGGTAMNAGVIFIDEVNSNVGSDSFSVSSETSSNFCNVIVGSVEEESNRRDELWGT